MVRACDTIVADASSPLDECMSSSEMCFSDLDSGWYDTPPDTPRSISPDLLAQLTSVPFCLSLCASSSSKKDPLDRLILDCDEYLNPLHPKPSSPVMWNSSVCERSILLEGKESSPLPVDTAVIEEISSEAFLGLLDRDSIFSIDETFSTKRKSCDEESMESKKAKARKTRDALSDQVPCSPDSRRHSHSVLERKRRHDLKTCYEDLRCSIPTLLDTERASTSLILQRAVELIESLKSTEEELLGNIQALSAENARLRGL